MASSVERVSDRDHRIRGDRRRPSTCRRVAPHDPSRPPAPPPSPVTGAASSSPKPMRDQNRASLACNHAWLGLRASYYRTEQITISHQQSPSIVFIIISPLRSILSINQSINREEHDTLHTNHITSHSHIHISFIIDERFHFSPFSHFHPPPAQPNEYSKQSTHSQTHSVSQLVTTLHHFIEHLRNHLVSDGVGWSVVQTNRQDRTGQYPR